MFPVIARICLQVAWILPLLIATSAGQDKKDASSRLTSETLLQEEAQDYYERWLKQDVVYIITPDERAVFEKLSTPEEKERFIEQFWQRRDPEPRTAANEFKEEHYRRIAYANEKFTSGYAGWRTDRGRIYIIHGPPTQIESYPGAGRYRRPIEEGGGTTATYPFEIWHYRYIEGLGSDIKLEFVDSTLSGEYSLAYNPSEKDAFFNMPGMGLTEAEESGLMDKSQRREFTGALRQPFEIVTGDNDPFQRFARYSQVLAPHSLKHPELTPLIDTAITYDSLPVLIREDYFLLSADEAVVPISIRLENRDLQFTRGENGVYYVRIAIYGRLTDLSNRVVSEFDEELLASFPESQLAEGRKKASIYQKILFINQKMPYKLDLVVKDLGGEKVSVIRKGLRSPVFVRNELTMSSLLLAERMQVWKDAPEVGARFVLGDVKVYPTIDETFSPPGPLGVYFHIYGAALDQSARAPLLQVTYRVFDGQGQVVRELLDADNESVHFFSDERIILMRKIDLQDFPPGVYSLGVEVEDRISERSVNGRARFVVQDTIPHSNRATNEHRR